MSFNSDRGNALLGRDWNGCPANQAAQIKAVFHFYIFGKYFLQKYIFNITIYSFVPLPPSRRAAGGLPPNRGAVGTYM
jgi:hypothetical protein